jgi:internalin A
MPMPTPQRALKIIEECQKNKSKKLELSFCNLTEIPKEIAGFDWLESLSLSNNQLTKIEGLEQLTNLSELNLSWNQITKIEGLEQLTNLSVLELHNNQLTKIEGLEQLANLSRLYLHNNQLTKIEGLKQLANLSELYLDSNKLTKIEGLEQLANLSVLNLNSNQLTKIEGLEQLANLSVLYLHDNQLTKIEGLEQLTNLSILYLHDNPLDDTDLVLKSGENHWGIIKNIIDRREEKGDKITIEIPAKILLLGNHASGKSSLLHYIQNNDLEYSGDTTHLLKIEHYPATNALPNAIFYDFGGQDFYHGIYRTFLSVGSAYVLLWNNATNDNKIGFDSKGRKTQNFNINYWLGQKAHQETVKDPVLLVQTHAKENEKPIFIDKSIAESIEESFYVSLHKDYNPNKNQIALTYLKAHIDDLIKSRKVKREEQEWYKSFYENVLNEETVQAIPIENLLKYYKPTNKKDEQGVLSSLRYELSQFHNQGLVLYYPVIDANIVWLNPAGLVQDIHDNILQELKISQYKGQVPVKGFSGDPNLIRLLEEQKVIFKHLHGEKGTEYIIPNFLPLVEDNEIEYDLLTFGLNNPSFTLKFKDFLPIGLINQLICLFGRQPDKKKFWRDQLLFTFENKCKILIRLDFQNLEIKVYASFLNEVPIKEQEDINKYLFYCILAMYYDLEVIEYTEFVSASTSLIESPNRNIFDNKAYQPKDLYISRDDKYFVNYSALSNHDTNETRIASYTINEGVLSTEKAFEIPVKPFEVFTNKKMNAMKKVFISYSKDDLSMVHRFRDALIPLHDEGIIESPWYCTFLEAGSDWNAEIQQKLQESDIVFFMCSMSFIRTKYIREHEIKTAIEAKKTIIPVIINFCEWDNYLGKYTALPYTSKPVADFKNQDLAWLLVTKGVRWSLETDASKKEELEKQVRKLYERLVEGKLDA